MQTLIIDVASQQLHHLQDKKVLKSYLISTAAKGVGEKKGSEQTPRGQHIIRAKIGANYPKKAVFVGRRFTGEIYSPELALMHPNRDWILSRILWLSGLELGKNRLQDCDTMQRYIYIHGCPDEKITGTPASHGCIRMHNDDIIELFDLIPPKTPVLIQG
ncbi:L,D-transpeptidase [Candidatus Berkiella aquae]|uniref:L,D-transpeptidase n=1 Tax=Candidatus Berkiella aquae TaxID=295108 RepID=A0AAE3HXD6_9GAMM|nr:L,D-transpeptidase [Candidatus Berkiella aquae]